MRDEKCAERGSGEGRANEREANEREVGVAERDSPSRPLPVGERGIFGGSSVDKHGEGVDNGRRVFPRLPTIAPPVARGMAVVHNFSTCCPQAFLRQRTVDCTDRSQHISADERVFAHGLS